MNNEGFPNSDWLGPELVVHLSDPEVGLKGVAVIDNSTLGPCGGGTRMRKDLTTSELCDLARRMTYNFGLIGLPRGGSKAGLVADPNMPDEKRSGMMRAFGRLLTPYIKAKVVAFGPDQNISVRDVADIYKGAGVVNLRSGLFEQLLDGDAASFHVTGYGANASVMAVCEERKMAYQGTTIAVDGFTQLGVGAARYAAQNGAKIVAISTSKGAVYSPAGLDVGKLLELRREFGEDCVLRYEGGEKISNGEICFLPVDVIMPGLNPYGITAANQEKIQAKIVVPAGYLPMTDEAEALLFDRGVTVIPDFLSGAGAAIASWVDFLEGNLDQAFTAIGGLIGDRTHQIVTMGDKTGTSAIQCAKKIVEDKIRAKKASNAPAKSFDETKVIIKKLLGM